jgi:hypothetical protein
MISLMIFLIAFLILKQLVKWKYKGYAEDNGTFIWDNIKDSINILIKNNTLSLNNLVNIFLGTEWFYQEIKERG